VNRGLSFSRNVVISDKVGLVICIIGAQWCVGGTRSIVLQEVFDLVGRAANRVNKWAITESQAHDFTTDRIFGVVDIRVTKVA
jgi:hypothetical protein